MCSSHWTSSSILAATNLRDPAVPKLYFAMCPKTVAKHILLSGFLITFLLFSSPHQKDEGSCLIFSAAVLPELLRSRTAIRISKGEMMMMKTGAQTKTLHLEFKANSS